MTNYDKRIKTICSFVSSSNIADIGADHGYITKCLFESNKISHAYVTDISAKCLKKAEKNLAGFSKFITFLVGDGLSVFDNILGQKNKNYVPVDIIIAGMGGREIIKILSQNKQFSTFILSPQRDVVLLREFLVLNNFFIEKDVIAKTGKMFYNILCVKKTNKRTDLTVNELYFGKTNLEDKTPDFLEYVAYRKNRCEEILKQNEAAIDVQRELNLLNELDLGEKNVWENYWISKFRY